MRICIEFDDDGEVARYFAACARIRKITTRALVRRLIGAVAEDQLVSSILDDEDSLLNRRKGEHTYRGRPFAMSSRLNASR